ncbi:MAG: hypothetical protein QM400_04185 [Spirochaetota bacterium]|nr:hypothetical protein [Spirochaetota bacterium]
MKLQQGRVPRLGYYHAGCVKQTGKIESIVKGIRDILARAQASEHE